MRLHTALLLVGVLLLLAVVPTAAANGPQIFVVCSVPNLPIPDSGSASDTITILGPSETLTDLDVYVKVPHTWVGDLSFTLEHVGSSGPVTIIDRPGLPQGDVGVGCSANDYDVTVNDEGTDTPIENQCSFTPPAISGDAPGGDPPGPVLSAFDGDDFTGDWVLTISDNIGADVGTLLQWCLRLTGVPDADGDGVPDDADYCPDTVIPEATVPSEELGTNRWALVNADGAFDTTSPKGVGPGRSYSIEDTAGCSCEQIIEQRGLGKGHVKFGCSIGVMDEWVDYVSQP